jgi:hypothetical protein
MLPMYYDRPEQWAEIMKTGMRDVTPFFDAGRMADEYYQRLYAYEAGERSNFEGILRKAV